ncbi:MAG: aminotransferase class III-fold pyridoxal phosphate-dependent enzyme [Deltaproteobacteria bacterium]|nr:aminotransferase class III-fold pyridoxal phosphate-dependent enzyme [Deltaproteobacteria bacterium]
MPSDARDHVFTLYPYHNAIVQSAQGCLVRDTEGREYVDLAAGQLSASLGHGHPRLLEAARRQAEKVVHVGSRFLAAATLDGCAAIAGICPRGLDKVVLCSTGSEANELAIRMARAATGKHELVGVRQGYYGATHATLSLSDYVGFIRGLGVRAAGVHRLACPDCRRCPLGLEERSCDAACVKRSAAELRADSTGDIAAFLVEPVLGSGGIIVPPARFFAAVRQLADGYGALLIADEAQTGLGRTGRWLGMEHFGVRPDICVLSKGLGAGFPVAAVVTSAEIEERCIAAPLANMSSHSFDPFAGAIAAEVIRIIRDDGLVERADAMGRHLRARLQELVAHHAMLANVRGLGLMVGLDALSPESGEPSSLFSLALEAECLLEGVILGYSALSGVLRLLPPLTIAPAEIDRAIDGLDRAAARVAKSGLDLLRHAPTHAGSMKMAATFLTKL